MTVEMAVAAAGATAKAAREVAVMAVAEEKWAGAKVAVVEVAVNLVLRRDGGGDGGRGRDGGGGDNKYASAGYRLTLPGDEPGSRRIGAASLRACWVSGGLHGSVEEWVVPPRE